MDWNKNSYRTSVKVCGENVMWYNQRFPFIFRNNNDFEHTRFMLTYQRKARVVYIWHGQKCVDILVVICRRGYRKQC